MVDCVDPHRSSKPKQGTGQVRQGRRPRGPARPVGAPFGHAAPDPWASDRRGRSAAREVYPPPLWGTVTRFDWPAQPPVWQTSGVARSSADAARLPPGGPEASPTVLVVPVQGRTYGNLPGSVSGVPARHPVGFSPPVRGSGRARTSQGRDVRTRDICVSESATRPTAWVGGGAWRHKGSRVQSVTRDRTTE